MIVFLHGAPVFGAVEAYVCDIVRGLQGAEEPVVLVHPDVPELEPFRSLSGGNVELRTFPHAWLHSSPRLAIGLTQLLRRLRPRVVHITDVWAPAIVAARLARVSRVLVTHHTPELPRRDNALGRLWGWLAWSTHPEVIYTSGSDRRHDGRSPAHVVYYGIDLDRFAAAQPALRHDGPVIGNVARLAPQKAQRDLIAAAPAVVERHPRARFVLVGDGPLRDSLEAEVEAQGLRDSFLFLGHRTDVPELLASFDVFVLPSLFEGLCYAVIEAQAAGVPVVATPVGGVGENVVEGETGLLVAPGDPDALAQRLIWILDHPEERRALAEEGRRRARGRYSKERMVEETIALYD